MLTKLTGLTVWLAAAGATAQEVEHASLCGIITSLVPEISPFSANTVPPPSHMAQLRFRVARLNVFKPCKGFITMSEGLHSTSSFQRRLKRGIGNHYINYNYFNDVPGSWDASRVLRGCPYTGVATQYQAFEWPSGNTSVTRTFAYRMRLDAPPAGSARSGVYTDIVSLQAYIGEVGDCSHPSGLPSLAILTYTVDSGLDISLVDVGGSFHPGQNTRTMDFGSLTPGEFREFDVSIRHNDGFRLAARTLNGSKLVHQGAVGPAWNYRTRFNGGAPVAVGKDPTYYAACAAPPLLHSYTNVRVRIEIASPGPVNPLAGTYSDVMTFDIAAF